MNNKNEAYNYFQRGCTTGVPSVQPFFSPWYQKKYAINWRQSMHAKKKKSADEAVIMKKNQVWMPHVERPHSRRRKLSTDLDRN